MSDRADYVCLVRFATAGVVGAAEGSSGVGQPGDSFEAVTPVEGDRLDDGGCRVEVLRPGPRVGVCRVAGSVDLGSYLRLEECLRVATAGADVLVVELCDVLFMDSKGVQTLLSVVDHVQAMKVVTPRRLRSLFRIAGLDQVVDVVGCADRTACP